MLGMLAAKLKKEDGMSTHLSFCRGLSLVLVCGGLVAAQATGAPPELPRYRLQVGQELQYAGKSEFKYDNGQHNTDSTWRIWVVRQNKDGGWRLVIRSGSTFSQGNAKRSTPADERVTFAWCDISPAGEITENDSFGFRLRPNGILPRLPEDATAMKIGWTSEYRRLDEQHRYKVLPDQSAEGKIAIEGALESAMNEIYGVTNTHVVTFDLSRGLPEKVVESSTQTYGFNGQGTGTTSLEKIETHDAAWTRDFTADTDGYFAAKQVYDKATSIRNQSPDDLEKSMQKAVADLISVRETIKTPELQQQLDRDIKQHDQYVSYYTEEAKKRQTLLNHPAAEWICQDLAGKEHALKDYRGRVVVLDFWYRGCGWCIRAMPQMKELAAHFKDQPVTVFGMNTDRDEADAQFVIDKLALNYLNLKAKDIPSKYSVQGFPTLLIIDQDGILRDIHSGYSPTLKEEVVKSIEGLLNR